MNRTTLIVSFLLLSAYTFSQTPTKAETAFVNGKNIYYEVYGKGSPLFLLHGYTLSSQSWKPYVADFESNYQVYLVDLTGHGKSDQFTDVLSVRSVAQDLNALMGYLEINRMKAIGFSFGGDILYQLALINPGLIDEMITIGAVGTWTVDDFPEYKKAFTFEKRTDFPWLLEYHKTDEKVQALMDQFRNYKVKLSIEELKAVLPETLIIMGDDDEGMDLKEVARVREHLPKSDLWVLPNVSHGAHEGETKEEFVDKVNAFFSKN